MINDHLDDRTTRLSSLVAVHKLSTADPHYDLQLLREINLSNTRLRLAPDGPTHQRYPGEDQATAPNDKTVAADEFEIGPNSWGSSMISVRQAAAAATLAVSTGCSSLTGALIEAREPPSAAEHLASTTTVDRRYVRPEIQDGKLIMPFFDHDFGSACFDTLECRISYKNRYDTEESDPSGSLNESDRRNFSASWLIFDMPSIAHATWTSKDGSKHDEEIDLGKIFQSKLVRYSPDLDVNDVDLTVYYTSPEIFLIVNNRSIHVYMKAHIPMLHPVDPGNRYSAWRRDLVAVYMQTF